MVLDRLRLPLARLARSTPPFRGKTRILRALDRALVSDVPTLTESDGVRWKVNTRELIDFSILYEGSYSADVTQALARLAGARPVTIWDVGANVGAVSLRLARLLPNAQIVSFEPSPRVFSRFLGNLELNDELASRITPLAIAISDVEGEVPFFPSNELFNQGVGGLYSAKNRTQRSFFAHAATADGLLARGVVSAPDLMKLDVEGWEREVLEGMRNTLKGGHCKAVLFEQSVYRNAERKQHPRTMCNLLEGHGFSIHLVRPGGALQPLREADLAGDCDLVGLR